ncbi:unnamed protein product [Caenorhabditis sp. 36 PRJEB53466]|nr:unnamed protein product [Caenorhabditis sp. 36 PRJEB53466]
MAIIFPIAVALLVIYILSFYDTIRLMRKFWVYGEKIPGPPAHPIFGNAALFKNKTTEEFVEIFIRLANDAREKGANLMRVQMMGKIYVWPLNGRTAATILESSTEGNKGDDYKFLHPWLGGGLLMEALGDRWKRHRKMLTPAFHFAKLEGYLEVFNSETKIMIDCLEKGMENGETIDLFPYIKRCALDIICKTAMGIKIDAQIVHDHQYVRAVEGFNKLAVEYSMNPFLWNRFIYWALGYQKMHDDFLYTLKKFTNDAIVERRAAIASGKVEKQTSKRKMNFLDILLSSEESNELTSEDIRQEVDTFIFAGHDTTTTALSWVCWNLAHNPEVQEKVYSELVDVFGEDPNEDVTPEGINKLEYTERVLKESKRVVAPVPGVQRKLTKDIVIDGMTIPSEANITISPTVLHCNPQVYPNPDKFDPDRFLVEESVKRNAYDYIPFSAGLRNCIGQKFSQLNEKVMLIHLMKNFRIEPNLDYYGTKPTFEVVAKPSNGIPVKLIRRRH